MLEKDIKDMTKDELINPNFIPSVFDNYDKDELDVIIPEILSVAKKYKVLTVVKKSMDRYKAEDKFCDNNVYTNLTIANVGTPEVTVDNYEKIMREDPLIKNLFAFNAFANKYVRLGENKERAWEDSDDSFLRSYIETTYGIYNQKKYYDAFANIANERSYHPVKELIEYKKWDGKPRIDRFLVDILGCDDDDYSREVSRMIFYGGISRLYKPGCKFDYMPIFIGNQGSGKTTIINWLALNDDYYQDISSIEGKDALENLQGRWICEFSELLAMVRTKDVEAMKSFVTRTVDKYRASYAKRSKEYPRQCIFIGTTNDHQFLSDKTGNRRYLPIVLDIKQGEIFKHEKKIRKYIMDCWREALYLLETNKIYLTIPTRYQMDVQERQSDVLEDDPKTGLMLDYLNQKKLGERVCAIEIFTNCFNGIKKNFDRLQGKEISRILSSLPDWERSNKGTHRFETYGVQRFWEKVEPGTKKHGKEVNLENDKDWDDLD